METLPPQELDYFRSIRDYLSTLKQPDRERWIIMVRDKFIKNASSIIVSVVIKDTIKENNLVLALEIVGAALIFKVLFCLLSTTGML